MGAVDAQGLGASFVVDLQQRQHGRVGAERSGVVALRRWQARVRGPERASDQTCRRISGGRYGKRWKIGVGDASESMVKSEE